LIEGLLDRQWDHVYPQLDPDDDNDPTARINALALLVEQAGTLVDARVAPLAASRLHGVVTLRDIEYATGEIPTPEGVEVPSMASIDAIIADARDGAIATYEAALAARRSTTRIETLLTERVGAAQSIDLSPLSKLMQHAASFLGERVSQEEPAAAADSLAQDAAMSGGMSGGMSAAPAAAPVTGDVSSRQDVVKMIDKICAYYEKHEPSSPVPLLLVRARRLVDKSFMEILEDLAPEGLGQARQIGGIENE
jgi:type VI secretion system protein ImpA